MSQFLFIVLTGSLVLSIASSDDYDYFNGPKETEGACRVYHKMALNSLKTGYSLVGKKELQMEAGYSTVYQAWTLEAGIGWFVFRNTNYGYGWKLVDVEGGCENAKPGTKLVLYKKAEPEDNNKFVLNSDGTLQSLCSKDLYVKAVTSGRYTSELFLADIKNRSISEEDIRFSITIL